MKTCPKNLSAMPVCAAVALSVCAIGCALNAASATIDFESLPGMPNAIIAVPASSQLSDQFLSTLGVRFSSASPYAAIVDLGFGHPTSGRNAIGGTTPGGFLTYDAAYPIVA